MVRLLAWIMLAVWSSWISAAQGLAVAHSSLGLWVPDLGLALALACAASFDRRDAPRAALVVALGRIAFTTEPPAAVLAGFLLVALVVRASATVTEVEGPLVRSTLASLSAWGLAGWLLFVRRMRDASGPEVVELVQRSLATWPVGLSTGLCALLLQPRLARLPGLSPLRKPRW